MSTGQELRNFIHDPERLRALRDVALLDTPAEEGFDRLSRLAVRFTGVDTALVSLIDEDRQFFKSCIGLPEPWSEMRESPLSYSFCQHNRVPGTPLVIPDARQDPHFRDIDSVREWGVIAYLGIPLTTPDGYVLGSFCTIDDKPHHWSAEEIAVVEDLAASTMTEIHLRAEIALRRRAEDQREELSRLYRRLEEEMDARLRAEAERRRFETRALQSQKLDSLGLLAGGVAHDFNNLLTAIRAGLQLLEMDVGEDPSTRSRLQQVEGACDRAAELVGLLLTYAGHERVRAEHCDPAAVIDDTARVLGSTLRQHPGLDLRLELDDGLPPVTVEPGRLRQTVLNLLLNAADASRPDGGRIVVRAQRVRASAEDLASPYLPEEETPPAGDYVRLEVEDEGSGMDAETRARLFDPFYTTKDEGHGLGMAAILGAIRAAGGSIRVETEPGEGTRFVLWFPVRAGPDDTRSA